jgi:hypothetical protein
VGKFFNFPKSKQFGENSQNLATLAKGFPNKGRLLRVTTQRRTIRVARWYIFRPKIAIWVNFGRSCNVNKTSQHLHVGMFY